MAHAPAPRAQSELRTSRASLPCSRDRRSWLVLVLLSAAIALLGSPAAAPAFNEGGTVDPWRNSCSSSDSACHEPTGGEHGNYTSTTHKCQKCHTLHAAASDTSLLARETVEDSCNTCHDGSGGRGVYGTIAARGLTVTSGHRIDVTRTIPGGDGATGGSALGTFKGENSNLTCVDCHTPHRNREVIRFIGDRHRTWAGSNRYSGHLLKRSPGGTSTVVTFYGSDWCISCHAGRAITTALHNHPVDTIAVSGGNVQRYDLVYGPAGPSGINTDPEPTATITFMGMWDSHRGYLWPFPRRGGQIGRYPICQQCHEDARNPGELSEDGNLADAALWYAPEDGVADGNPRIQNFPHESTNRRLLVEEEDSLCTNCHPTSVLP